VRYILPYIIYHQLANYFKDHTNQKPFPISSP